MKQRNIVFIVLILTVVWFILLFCPELARKNSSTIRNTRRFSIASEAPVFQIHRDGNGVHIRKSESGRTWANGYDKVNGTLMLIDSDYIDISASKLSRSGQQGETMSDDEIITLLFSVSIEGREVKMNLQQEGESKLTGETCYSVAGDFEGEIWTYGSRGENQLVIPAAWTDFETVSSRLSVSWKTLALDIVLSLVLAIGSGVLISRYKTKRQFVVYISLITVALIALNMYLGL